ncbi:hypothetical protein EG68_06984, partial [Paragonimus skrjabini miyazakii]
KFYFSATRVAYLLAALSQKTELPDGTQIDQVPSEYSMLQHAKFSTTMVNADKPQSQQTDSSDGNQITFVKPVASKLDKCVTESHSRRVAPVYADWCGVVRDRHGPFWPTGRGPLYPAPRHSRPDGKGLLRTDKHYVRNSLIAISNAVAKNIAREKSSENTNVEWKEARLVYDCDTSSRWTPVMLEAIASSSQLLGRRTQSVLVPPSLVFESRFECGNLGHARRIGLYDYELTLKPDLYTRRHVQWFYFAVRNAIPGVVYRFVIVNFTKPTSLYSKGMKILFFSEKETASKGSGWYRTGENIM